MSDVIVKEEDREPCPEPGCEQKFGNLRGAKSHYGNKHTPPFPGLEVKAEGSYSVLQKRKSKERDGYCCVSCGKSGDFYSLESHHIIPIKEFEEHDDYRLAHSTLNLVTVCRPCHSTLEVRSPEVQLTHLTEETPERTEERRQWIDETEK